MIPSSKIQRANLAIVIYREGDQNSWRVVLNARGRRRRKKKKNNNNIFDQPPISNCHSRNTIVCYRSNSIDKILFDTFPVHKNYHKLNLFLCTAVCTIFYDIIITSPVTVRIAIIALWDLIILGSSVCRGSCKSVGIIPNCRSGG